MTTAKRWVGCVTRDKTLKLARIPKKGDASCCKDRDQIHDQVDERLTSSAMLRLTSNSIYAASPTYGHRFAVAAVCISFSLLSTMKSFALQEMSLSLLLLQAFLLPVALSQYLPSYPLVSYYGRVEWNEKEIQINLSVGCSIALSVK